jgi:phosphonate transport system substrate-binding protein
MLFFKTQNYRLLYVLIFSIFVSSAVVAEPAENIEKVETAKTAVLPQTLSLSFMPYMVASELMKMYTPLANYLTQQIGIPVQIHITKNYVEHNRLLGEDQVDIAFMGGIPYVTVTKEYGKKPLLARYEMNGKPTFHSVIFVPQGSPLTKLDDLIGQRFAFGDPNSTLSTVVPRYMLHQAGVTLNKLAAYDFLKNHQNVIFGVLLGDYAAGAVAEEIFKEYEKLDIRVLELSPALSTHLFITRKDLPQKLITQLQTALYHVDEHPNGKAILSAIGKTMTGFVPVADEDYDLLRSILMVNNEW